MRKGWKTADFSAWNLANKAFIRLTWGILGYRESVGYTGSGVLRELTCPEWRCIKQA